MKTKKLNKKKKKIWEHFGKDRIKTIQEFEMNDRGELVLVKSQSFDYDNEEMMYRRCYTQNA